MLPYARMPLSRTGRRAGVLLLAILLALAFPYPFGTHEILDPLGSTFSFLAAYGLARYLTGHRGAALLCGIAYAYCPFVFMQMNHAPLLMTCGIPLALLALHRLIDRPTLGRAGLLAAALVAQALFSASYGIFAGLAVGLGVLYYAVTREFWHSLRYGMAVGFAAALTVILLILLPRFGYVPMPDVAEIVKASAGWRALLAPSFPGLITTCLGLAAIWLGLRDKPIEPAPRPAPLPGVMVPVALRSQNADVADLSASAPRGEGEREPTRETTIFYAAIGALAFGASLVPLVHSPARFGILVVLALAVLMAIAVRDLLARASARTRSIAIAGLACALIVELAILSRMLIGVSTDALNGL